MNKPTRRLIAMLAAAVVLHATPGLASRIPPFMVSGAVSAVTGNQITVNGTTYSVQVQGPALQQAQQLQPGQQVDLVLSGPAGAASTQVVAIHVRAAH